VYNETTHRFFFHVNDTERQKRIGEVSGYRAEVPPILRSLGRHEFLYQNVDQDEFLISKVELNA
jgi:hypothetical protein